MELFGAEFDDFNGSGSLPSGNPGEGILFMTSVTNTETSSNSDDPTMADDE
jgi:hypothetical protein